MLRTYIDTEFPQDMKVSNTSYPSGDHLGPYIVRVQSNPGPGSYYFVRTVIAVGDNIAVSIKTPHPGQWPAPGAEKQGEEV